MNNHLITSGKIHRLLGAWITIFMLLWAGNAASQVSQIFIGNAPVLDTPTTTPVYYTYSENGTVSNLIQVGPVLPPEAPSYVMICKSSVGDTLKVIVKNVTITKASSIAGVYCNLFFGYSGPVELQLEGTNTLSQNLAEDNDGEKAFYGIYHIPSSPDRSGLRGLRYVLPSLTVINKGTLNITGNVGGVIGNESAGIYATGNLIVDNQGTMTISNPKTLDFSAGLRAYNSLTIKGNGKMTVTGGELTTTTRSSDNGSFGLYSLYGKIRILSGKVTAQGGKTVMNPSLGIYAADSLIVAADTLIAQGDSAGMNKKYSRIDLTAYNAKGFPAMMVDTLYDGSTKQSSLYETYFLENDTIKYVEITQGYPIYIGNAHLELPSLGSDTTYYTYSEADHSILKNDGTKDNYQVSVSLTKNGSVDSLLVVTLNGISITKMNPVTYNSNLFIYHADSTALVLNGNNTLTNGVSQNSAMMRGAFIHTSIIENSLKPSSFKPLGIYNKGTFTITGSGSDMYSFGMYLMNPLTYLHNEGTIDVQGLNAGYNSCGLISEEGSVIVDGEGKATIAAGTVSATDGKKMGGSLGVMAQSLTIKSGTVIAQGHTMALEGTPDLNYEKGFPFVLCDTLYDGSTAVFPLIGEILGYFGKGETIRYYKVTPGHPIYVGDQPIDVPETEEGAYYKYSETAGTSKLEAGSEADFNVGVQYDNGRLNVALKDLTVTKENPMTMNSNLFIYNHILTQLNLIGNNKLSHNSADAANFRTGIVYMNVLDIQEKSKLRKYSVDFIINNTGNLAIEGNKGAGTTHYGAGAFFMNLGKTGLTNKGIINIKASDAKTFSTGVVSINELLIGGDGEMTAAAGTVSEKPTESSPLLAGSYGMMGNTSIASGTVTVQGHDMFTHMGGIDTESYDNPFIQLDSIYEGTTATLMQMYESKKPVLYYKISPSPIAFIGNAGMQLPAIGTTKYYTYAETSGTGALTPLASSTGANVTASLAADSTLTVTLNDVTITKSSELELRSEFEFNSNLSFLYGHNTHLVFTGKNSLSQNSNSTESGQASGIYMDLASTNKMSILTVTNQGTLNISNNVERNSYMGICAPVLAIDNQKIMNVTAQKAVNSRAIYAMFVSFSGTGELIAAGNPTVGTDGKSYGIDANKIFVKSGIITAQGATSGVSKTPILQMTDPIVGGGSAYDGSDAVSLTDFTNLNAYKYLVIGKQVSKNLADADVQLNGELILNGNQVRPGVKVTYKGKTLTEGVDYIVTYGPNNEVGNNKGTVTVTGIGDYSGTKTLTFNIYAKPVYVIIEKTDGVSVTPGFGLNLSGIGETFEFTVTPNASLGKEGKDFTIEVRTDRAETLLPIGNKYKIDAVDHETTIYIIVKKLTTGVESIDALNVYGGNGTITIQSPTNSTALVVNMTGQIVKSTKITSGKTVFNGMQKGIYAVKIGSTVMKVVVN